MPEHPNARRVREALEAFDRGDFETFGTFLADDIVWHVGGSHPLSRDYNGRGAVLDYCRRAFESSGRTLKGERLEVLAGDRHAGVFNRVVGERPGKRLDAVIAQAITFDAEGRWIEYWALADKQDQVNEFWSAAIWPF